MFDARSILDTLLRGGGQPPGPAQGQQPGANIFGDLLAQLGGQAEAAGGRRPPPREQQDTDEDDRGRGGERSPSPARKGQQDEREEENESDDEEGNDGEGGDQDDDEGEGEDESDGDGQRGQSRLDPTSVPPTGPSAKGAGEAAPPPGKQPPPGSPPPASGGSLEDLLRTILGGGQTDTGGQAGPEGGKGGAGSGPGTGPQPRPGPGGSSLQDILRDLLRGQGASAGGASKLHAAADPGQGGQGGAGLLDALRQMLGQATEGVREGAGKIDQATGASQHARDALGRATGQSPEDLIARLRDLISNNQLATGAALGGLGALILGTRAGRSLAGTAARLGGLALIGGLAYKAYQNYQQGRPILGGDNPPPQNVQAAPAGTGFEAGAVTQETATLYIRAMIAAAAADGRIDDTERERILGGLAQAGLDQAAQQFLTAEINNPATPQELARGVSSREEALQVYTAARIVIDADSAQEHAFLAALAQALGIDAELAAQVDAAARGGGK